MTDKIWTGNDRAHEMGLKDYREMIHILSDMARVVPGKPLKSKWTGEISKDPKDAVYAYVDAGRWAAECECGEACYVEPEDPIMWCVNCGNFLQDGKARPVIFPANRADIEKALLERRVVGDARMMAKLGTQAVGFSKLIFPLHAPRHWMPGQTVEDLREEHRQMKIKVEAARKALNNG